MPKGAFWKVGLGSALLLLVSAAPGWCDTVSLVLASNSGGVYDYSLVFGSTGVSFFAGDGINLSLMSGVTGASVEPGSLLYLAFGSGYLGATFTATTADYTQSAGDDAYITGPGTYGTLVADSSVLTLGTIDYSMVTEQGTFTGTAQGPVSPATGTPEPSSLALLLTGMTALGLVMGLARRKEPQDRGPSQIAAF